MALPKKKWREIRVEYETSEVSVNKLAEKHGISHTAVRKKILQENWQRLKVSDKKQNSGVFENVHKDIEKTCENDEKKQGKVAIILKHRQQWELPIQIIESAIEFDENGNLVKIVQSHITHAKRVAETLEIIQRNERIAWGIDKQFGQLTDIQIRNRNKILQKCIDGEIDSVAHAGMLFDLAGIPMPDSIRIILQKTPVENSAPEPDDVFSEEELDAEYNAAMKKIEEQREQWLPKRVKNIEEMKHDIKEKDSFSSDFQIKIR